MINWPHVPVSAASLPNGKIMTFSGQERDSWPGTKTQTYWTIYDPVTNRFDESLYLNHEMFCAHLVMRTDGNVQTVGGRYTIEHSSVFDFRSNEWKRVDDLEDKRWYTTAVALPDGDVFTVAGSGGPNTAERFSVDTQQWTKLTGIDWQPVSGAAGFESNWWPYLWVAPNGQLFHFGPTESMNWVNPDGNGQRTSAGISVPNNHYPKHAGVTMYDSGKILVAGGAATTGGGSSNICYTVDLNTTPPTVQQVASMRFPRRFSNAVVLPSGEVMIVGGNTSGISDEGTVLTPEIWNPRTNTWREVADMARPRNYHSVGLLLADGRVFAGGNGYPNSNQQNGEIYTPPSLYTSGGQLAGRPVLSSAPDNVSCGSIFQVQGTPNLKKFAAIRLVATTHGLTTDQRYLSLPFSEATSGNYQLVAHPNPNVMVPGYWMIFGLNANGVHSASKIAHVNEMGNASISGLKGSYHNSIDLTNKRFERIDHQIDFNYGSLSPDTAQLGNDNFSESWTGWVVPETTGTYTFCTLSDDGVRLRVNDQLLVNNWTLHGPIEDTGTISLTAGVPVPITLDHYEAGGGASIRLSWSGPGVAKQVIPEKNLRHANPSSMATVAVDDVFELYVNGKLVSIGTEWNRAYHSTFSTSNSTIIAIRACNTVGPGSALGDFMINGTRILTNSQWKVSASALAGWNQPGFNDSGWSNATDLGGVPAGVSGMPTNSTARSIWSASNADDEVFLRFTVGAPDIDTVSNRADTSGQSIDFTIPVTAASGATLTFSEANFPIGANINASTGRVTGTLSGQGVFNASVTVTDQNGLSDTVTFQWVVRLPGQGSGSILREWWTGIVGNSVTNLTSDPRYPNNPTESGQVSAFPTSQNFADNYGTRLRGYLHAP
ncbi:MAG: PA14 domain-containing protein, partial [Verrucomicrobiales bacterium]